MRVRSPGDLGAIAREQRRKAGLSQADVAERAGVTRQWLVRFERGNTEVSLSKAFAVLRTLEITVSATPPDIDTVESGRSVMIRIPRVEMPLLNMETLGRSIENARADSSDAMMSSIRETIRKLNSRGSDDPEQQ